MGRSTIGQKATRTLQLMLALRNPNIARQLARHGFTEADLEKGMSLLFALTRGRLGEPPKVVGPDPQLVRELDAWENKWLPIVSAVLAANHPEAREAVFLNLSQTSGAEVVVSVGTFLDRLEQLPRSEEEGGLGRDGKAARDLLARRGLTREVAAQARDMIARVPTIAASEEIASDERSEADIEAERQLWNWYLEWSAIARAVITDRRLLRQMGFLQGSAEPDEPAAPAAPSDPTPAG